MLLESFAFEDFEDDKPIPWMGKKFQDAVKSAESPFELVEGLRKIKFIDAWDVVEVLIKRIMCKR